MKNYLVDIKSVFPAFLILKSIPHTSQCDNRTLIVVLLTNFSMNRYLYPIRKTRKNHHQKIITLMSAKNSMSTSVKKSVLY